MHGCVGEVTHYAGWPCRHPGQGDRLHETADELQMAASARVMLSQTDMQRKRLVNLWPAKSAHDPKRIAMRTGLATRQAAAQRSR